MSYATLGENKKDIGYMRWKEGMNISILSEGEQVLFSGHEKRWAPGGKEVAPAEVAPA